MSGVAECFESVNVVAACGLTCGGASVIGVASVIEIASGLLSLVCSLVCDCEKRGWVWGFVLRLLGVRI